MFGREKKPEPETKRVMLQPDRVLVKWAAEDFPFGANPNDSRGWPLPTVISALAREMLALREERSTGVTPFYRREPEE